VERPKGIHYLAQTQNISILKKICRKSKVKVKIDAVCHF